MTRAQKRMIRRRKSVIKKMGGCRCHICGEQLDDSTMTLDHIVPKSKGGTKSAENILIACRKCNNERGDADVMYFKMQRLIVGKFPMVDWRLERSIRNRIGFYWRSSFMRMVYSPKFEKQNAA